MNIFVVDAPVICSTVQHGKKISPPPNCHKWERGGLIPMGPPYPHFRSTQCNKAVKKLITLKTHGLECMGFNTGKHISRPEGGGTDGSTLSSLLGVNAARVGIRCARGRGAGGVPGPVLPLERQSQEQGEVAPIRWEHLKTRHWMNYYPAQKKTRRVPVSLDCYHAPRGCAIQIIKY